jgi:predicted Zn-dependent peptidase
MIDRTIAPPTQEIDHVQLVEPEVYKINETTHLYFLENKHSEGFKLDLFFDAGFRKDNRLLAKLANKCALTGTLLKTSNQIDNEIDIYGGFTGQEYSSEDATITVLGQNIYFKEITSVVIDALAHAIIPERDFQQILATEKQRFIVDQKKVSTQARRLFLKNIYQGTPSYELTELADFKDVNQNEVVSFFNDNYKKGLTKVALIGQFSKEQLNDLIKDLKSFCGNSISAAKINLLAKPAILHHEIDGKSQSALRIGKPLFNRTHKDYPKFVLLNTLLGGYFGSRLMKTIREDKGLTYGIGSGIAQAIDHAYFFISTEVNKDKREEAIDLVLAEIEKIQKEKISEEELQIIKSYSIGQLLKNSDGPFAQMDRFLSVEKFGITMEYYNQLLLSFKECTAEDLMQLANSYLRADDLTICSAG